MSLLGGPLKAERQTPEARAVPTANKLGGLERGQPGLSYLTLACWSVGRAQVSEIGPQGEDAPAAPLA